jgi:hypothetical protein
MDEVSFTKTASFIADLDFRDHQRLREVTRRAYAKEFPGRPRLNDAACDYYIEQLGPQAGEKVLKAAVDARIDVC